MNHIATGIRNHFTMTQISLPQIEAADRGADYLEVSAGHGRARLKILVCAYACSPAQGSEYGVGWGWVEAISKYHDLWVLTGAQSKDEIEAELLRRPELRSRMRFHYISRKRYLWAEKLWPPAYLHTYKNQWQRAAFKVGSRLHQEIDFDVIHQLTYVGFRVPGRLWKLDAPFVWGPIGGLEQTTWSLIPALGVRGMLHYAARNLLNDLDRRIKLEPKRAFAKANGGIIAATTGIQREIRRFYGCDSTVVSEIGLPPISRREPARRLPSEPLALLWCGNHLHGKALPFLLQALRQMPSGLDWRLAIIGTGPCSIKWQRIARKLSIADRCEWLGQISRKAVLQRMQSAHVLVITSVHDLTSTVLVEALANGLSVVCPDHCGFTDAITPECGIKVPATSVRELVRGLRDAIIKLNDEAFRHSLAEGALRRSADYEWDRKAQTMNDIYFKKCLRATTVS